MRLRPCTDCCLAPAVAAALIVAVPSTADVVVLTSAKDNTLIEVTAGGQKSNALGDIFAGRTGVFSGGTRRRGLIRFDIAGNVPAGSTITGVALTLSIIGAPIGNPPQTCSLHRALADWGEGTSFFPGGQGAPATAGDATWLHTFFSTSFWGTAGGDFSPAASASVSVGTAGTATWGTTAGMVADVQEWLDNPGANFGWLILGNEAVQQTARRFGSHEAQAALQPSLIVGYTPPPPCAQDCGNDDNVVDTVDFLALLQQWPGPGSCDTDGDGVIDTVDFLDLLAHWGPCP
jgi:hypothetical protein